MKIPELSHLQILVLECLGTQKRPGRELRQLLTQSGTKKSGPAFYQLMARLEEAGLVEGEYSQKIVEKQISVLPVEKIIEEENPLPPDMNSTNP